MSGPLHCSLCQVTTNTELDFKAHMDGKRHARSTSATGKRSTTSTRTKQQRGKKGPDASPVFDETEKDKNGVTLKGEFDFGFVESASIDSSGPGRVLKAIILSTNTEMVNVSEFRLSSSTISQTSPFGIDHAELPLNLTCNVEETFSITLDSQALLGRHNDRVEVVFQHLGLNQQFVITRPIQATVGNKADIELLKPSSPYRPRPPRKQPPTEKEEDCPLPGVKPASLANMHWMIGLPLSPVPRRLIHVLDKKEVLKHQWLPRSFNAQTHGRFFQILLHAEEIQMSVDLQSYDMQDVEMDYAAPFYRLSVPDLAEKRPSIIIGDRIHIHPKESSVLHQQWLEGFVHHIHQGDIDLQFHKSFKGGEKGQRYDVRFQLDRIPFRRMHQALGLGLSSSDRLLFPSQDHVKGGSRVTTEEQIREMQCVNKSVESNFPQLLAVVSMVHMPEGSIPFIIFGPPGTGKTVVIVEAILQILSSRPHSHILACASSNSAADLLVERLKDTFTPSDMFRLNAPSRQKESLSSKELKPYSRFTSGPGGVFCIPSLSEMKEFKIIIATCMASSILHGMGIGNSHFSHVFIDEAGQASEPEVMVPIKMLAGEKTNVILSGDPKQLGPMVRSTAAASLGLATSYLDRLMARDVYTHHGISVVKLIKNWRNHPTILQFPNEQFYENQLEAHGDQLITHSLLHSPELVSPHFPIIFHGIIGQDMQQASSPSYFNPDEASVVRGYIERLGMEVKDTQMGVIAPYHAQVVKIRSLLCNSGFVGVKVGSVEEFQGQERRVIIISTVRSSIKHFDYDIRHALGFVANPRRFNVAMTRAQALLIIIGNPTVLSIDPLWRRFMNNVFLGGGWRGIRPDWDTKEVVKMMGDYGAVRRKMAMGEWEALMERTRTMTI